MAWGSWFTKATTWVTNNKSIDQDLADFFKPLMDDVKRQAAIVGNGNIGAGLSVLKDASLQAATAAMAAPPGTKVAVAEAVFVKTLAIEGVAAISNALSGLTKAAVAIKKAEVTPIALPLKK